MPRAQKKKDALGRTLNRKRRARIRAKARAERPNTGFAMVDQDAGNMRSITEATSLVFGVLLLLLHLHIFQYYRRISFKVPF
jgi:hypothetical protein